MVKITTLETRPRREFIEETEQRNLERLRERFGHNKKLPRGFELPALVALSHYPELINIKIEFVLKATGITLSARPTAATILLPPKTRTYQVIISKEANSTKEPVLLKNLDFNMQIGVIGHELAHIADLLQKRSIAVLRDSVMYNVDSYKSKIEKSAGRTNIKHGLGYQALAYARLVEKLKFTLPQEKYYQDFTKYNMSVAEIETRISKLKLYEE